MSDTFSTSSTQHEQWQHSSLLRVNIQRLTGEVLRKRHSAVWAALTQHMAYLTKPKQMIQLLYFNTKKGHN